MHVKEGYFFTPPKRVTLPTWGPSPPGTQALRSVMDWHHLHFDWQANARVSDEAVCGRGKEEFSFSFLAPCAGVPLARDYPHDSYISVSLFDSNYKKSLLAEIFAWESHDYRYATNVENSNKVTGGARGQMLEYERVRLRKKGYPRFKRYIENHSEMYRSWWYVVRTNLRN